MATTTAPGSGSEAIANLASKSSLPSCDTLRAENERLLNKVRELLDARLDIQRRMTTAVQALLKERKEKEELLSTLEEKLYSVTMERSQIIDRLHVLDNITADIERLRKELDKLCAQTTSLKALLANENFADTRTVEEAQRRITMKRTSTVTASMSAKLPQEHLGSIEELDGYVLIHRFDSVQIKSGTPRKIIEYLVHTTCDVEGYFNAFCLTYPSFTNAIAVIDVLEELYLTSKIGSVQDSLASLRRSQSASTTATSGSGTDSGGSSDGVPEESLQQIAELVVKDEQATKRRLRIRSFFKYWTTKHTRDFIGSATLVERFNAFTEKVIAVEGLETGKALQKLLRKKLLRNEQRSTTAMFDSPPPAPLLPSRVPVRSFLELDPVEIARQLTLRDRDVYGRICPSECLSSAWTSKQKLDRAPNILQMISDFNLLSAYIGSSVVESADIKERAHAITTWITIGEQLRLLNNYNGVMIVISGLTSAPVFRMKKTWEKVSSKRRRSYEELAQLMSTDSNSKKYREELHKCSPPLVPHIGVYLSDLTFIEEGNLDTLANGQVNFVKRRMLANVIQELGQYQQTPYNLMRVDAIQLFFEALRPMTETEQYQRSLQHEPRTQRAKIFSAGSSTSVLSDGTSR